MQQRSSWPLSFPFVCCGNQHFGIFNGFFLPQIANFIVYYPEKLGINPPDIFIVIIEPPLENWGMAGVQKG